MRTNGSLSGDRLRVYRTVPARVTGWIMVAGAALLVLLTIVDMVAGTHRGLAWPAALVVGAAGLGWALFLRPHVELRSDGLVLANIVTDTTIPFDAIEEITDRWALEVHGRDGRRFSSWAVPVRREWKTRRAVDDFAETTRRRGSGGMTAQGVADEVQRTLQRWRLDGGELRTDGEGTPAIKQQVSWAAVLVLALASGLLALALFS